MPAHPRRLIRPAIGRPVVSPPTGNGNGPYIGQRWARYVRYGVQCCTFVFIIQYQVSTPPWLCSYGVYRLHCTSLLPPPPTPTGPLCQTPFTCGACFAELCSRLSCYRRCERFVGVGWSAVSPRSMARPAVMAVSAPRPAAAPPPPPPPAATPAATAQLNIDGGYGGVGIPIRAYECGDVTVCRWMWV